MLQELIRVCQLDTYLVYPIAHWDVPENCDFHKPLKTHITVKRFDDVVNTGSTAFQVKNKALINYV